MTTQRSSRHSSPMRRLTRASQSKTSLHAAASPRHHPDGDRPLKQRRSKSTTSIFGRQQQQQQQRVRSNAFGGRNYVGKKGGGLSYATASRFNRGFNPVGRDPPIESYDRRDWLLRDWLQRSNASLPDSLDTGIGSMLHKNSGQNAVYDEIGSVVRAANPARPRNDGDGRSREPSRTSRPSRPSRPTTRHVFDPIARTDRSPTKSVRNAFDRQPKNSTNNNNNNKHNDWNIYDREYGRDLSSARPIRNGPVDGRGQDIGRGEDLGRRTPANSFTFRNVSLSRNGKGKFGFNVSSFKYIDNMFLPQIDAILPGSSAQINGIQEGDFIHLINRMSVEGIGLQRFLDLIVFSGEILNLQFLHPNTKELTTTFNYHPQYNAQPQRRNSARYHGNVPPHGIVPRRQLNLNPYKLSVQEDYGRENIRPARPAFAENYYDEVESWTARNMQLDLNARRERLQNLQRLQHPHLLQHPQLLRYPQHPQHLESVMKFDDDESTMSYQTFNPTRRCYDPYAASARDASPENQRFRSREYNSFTDSRSKRKTAEVVGPNENAMGKYSKYPGVDAQLSRRANILREKNNSKEKRDAVSSPVGDKTGPEGQLSSQGKLSQGKLAKCTSVIDIGSVQDVLLVKKTRKNNAADAKSAGNPLEDWSVDDVIGWLKHIGQFDLDDIVESNGLDGRCLLGLDRRKMLDIGITDVHQRWKIEEEIGKLKRRVAEMDGVGSRSKHPVIGRISEGESQELITHI